jgi:hypothetical protein
LENSFVFGNFVPKKPENKLEGILPPTIASIPTGEAFLV